MNQKQYFKTFIASTVVLLNILVSSVSAQDSTLNLNLNEAIDAALKNNKSIQLASMDENIAAANYKKTDVIYLPRVGFSYTAMGTNDPLSAFGFKLQQKSITQNDFDPVLLNNPSATANFSTKLELQQPLINMDMLYMRKAAARQTTLFEYKTQRTKEYITFEVQKAFLQIQLAYDAVKVLEEALQMSKSVYTFTNNHFQQGLIQKSDVLNAQVHISTVESSIAKAKSNIQNACDYMSLLMGQNTGVVYKVPGSWQDNQASTDTAVTVSFSRSDFMAMQKGIEAIDLSIKSDKMSYLPKLNAFGNYQLNDSRMLGFGANAYLVGMQLSWDIFKGNKTKNSIVVKTLERNKLKEEMVQQQEQSQLELNKAYRDQQDAQFEINQQNNAIEQASEAVRILQNRYQQGLVNTTDVLTADTQLMQQKFALAQAKFSINVTKAYIQYLTSSKNK